MHLLDGRAHGWVVVECVLERVAKGEDLSAGRRTDLCLNAPGRHQQKAESYSSAATVHRDIDGRYRFPTVDSDNEDRG